MNKEQIIKQMAEDYRLKWEEPRNTWHYKKGINAALSNTQLLESAGHAQTNGWISVEDRLPEYGIAVLLIISNGAMTIGYLKSATKVSRYRQWQLFGDMEDTLCVQKHDQVTHWQPLPQKPQP